MTKDIIVARIPVTQGEIRVMIQEFRGVQKMHIRRWYLDDNNQWRPTEKGVALSKEESILLLDAVQLGINEF